MLGEPKTLPLPASLRTLRLAVLGDAHSEGRQHIALTPLARWTRLTDAEPAPVLQVTLALTLFATYDWS